MYQQHAKWVIVVGDVMCVFQKSLCSDACSCFRFSPETTSDKSGAIFYPADFTSSGAVAGDERVQHWTRVTFDLFNKLYSSREASEIELCLMTGYYIKSSHVPKPWWKDLVYGFREISPMSPEAQRLHVPPSCVNVWAFTTYLLNCQSYLPWLTAKFLKNGGVIEKRRVSSLDEPGLCSYDLVINCVGMGAYSLVKDKTVSPVRGQGVLVYAPWVKHFVFTDLSEDFITYILPRARDVLLGGTAQGGNWSETPDPETSREIRSRCEVLMPGLGSAPVIDTWAGLRPVREKIRLEVERSPSSPGPPVIHCYGHGGQGIVLHWGCALEVGDMVEKLIVEERMGVLKSRL